MKQRNHLAQQLPADLKSAGTKAALAALLLLAACQNELPIQRPGGDCGMDPEPACVTISVGTKPAEEKTVAYGITTPANNAGTRTNDATRADATTRTNLTGEWQVGDRIVVSLQYYNDTEGTNPDNLLRSAEQMLTCNYDATASVPASGERPKFWDPAPELLPLPQGVRSIRVTYRYYGSVTMTNEKNTNNTSGDAVIVKEEYNGTQHTLVLGSELMAGHLEAPASAPTGIASITAPTPDDATQDGCTSLVVISDPTAAIVLPAPQWHRLTTQVRLTGMTPGQMVHLETGIMASEDSDGSSYTPTGGISLTAPDASDASPATYNARIYFQPAATTAERDKNVLTLYDAALSSSLNSPTPPRYFRLDCQPNYCYSFLASALNLSNAGADAQPVDGTDKNACLALLTKDNPHWVVSGGGDGESAGDAVKDKQVLENVRAALDAAKKAGASDGTIDLVLTGVKSLPTYKGQNDIDYGTFYFYTQLRSISAPQVTSIGEKTFQGCESLTTVSLPKATGSIGESAFQGCYALTTISLPKVTGDIGEYAFNACTALTIVNLPAAEGTIKQYAFQSCYALTTVNLPKAKGGIETSAFQSCYALTAISLPAAEGTIGQQAFQGCSSLTTVDLPQAKGGIGESAFQDCTALTTVYMPQATDNILKNAFLGCSKLTTVYMPLLQGSIGQYAFYGCSSLTTVDLSAVKSSIGTYAFSGCSKLPTLSLPAATSIGVNAFNNCSSLTHLDLPAATSIGEGAFNYCAALTHLDLSAATSIGDGAFINCSSLAELRLTAVGNITIDVYGLAFNGFNSSKKCTLYLNPNKAYSAEGEATPKVEQITDKDGATIYKWAGEEWKEIKFSVPATGRSFTPDGRISTKRSAPLVPMGEFRPKPALL